jgi:hypothetical protein
MLNIYGQKRVVFLSILSVMEAGFLGIGVFLPFAHIKEFWLFNSEFSVFSMAVGLIGTNNFLLGFCIIIFALLIPIIRLISNNFSLAFLDKINLHRLAMLDIFLVSFLIFSSQTSYLFEVNLLSGFYVLLAATLVSYLNFWLRKSLER